MADILIYKAGLVPVGLDQEPHLEVTRGARKMNENTADFPGQRFATKAVCAIAKRRGKMGKSVGSYINLTDSTDQIQKSSINSTATVAGEDLMIVNIVIIYKSFYNLNKWSAMRI